MEVPEARSVPFVLCTLLALAAVVDRPSGALAGDRKKAHGPDEAVLLLKAAWEQGDDEGIVERYAEPCASYVHTGLAAARRIDRAARRLERLTRVKLGPVVASELAMIDTRATCPLLVARKFQDRNPLVNLSVSARGNRATARMRLLLPDEGIRELPCAFAQLQGDWKLLLVNEDGEAMGDPDKDPSRDSGLARLAAANEAQERTAVSLEALANDLEVGKVSRRDELRKRLARILEREKAPLVRAKEPQDAKRRGERGGLGGDD